MVVNPLTVSPLLQCMVGLAEVTTARAQGQVLQGYSNQVQAGPDNAALAGLLAREARRLKSGREPLSVQQVQNLHMELLKAADIPASQYSQALYAPGGLSPKALAALTEKGDLILYGGILALDCVDLANGDLLLKAKPAHPMTRGLSVFHSYAAETVALPGDSRWLRFSGDLTHILRGVHQKGSDKVDLFAKDDQTSLATILRWLRKSYGFTQQNVAEALGVGRTVPSGYEKEGGNYPLIKSAARLDRLYGFRRGTVAKVAKVLGRPLLKHAGSYERHPSPPTQTAQTAPEVPPPTRTIHPLLADRCEKASRLLQERLAARLGDHEVQQVIPMADGPDSYMVITSREALIVRFEIDAKVDRIGAIPKRKT